MKFEAGKKYMIVDETLSHFGGCDVKEGDVYECHMVKEHEVGFQGCASKDVYFFGKKSPNEGYFFASTRDLEVGAVVEVEE